MCKPPFLKLDRFSRFIFCRKPNERQNDVELSRYFFNLVKFVFQYFHDSRRICRCSKFLSSFSLYVTCGLWLYLGDLYVGCGFIRFMTTGRKLLILFILLFKLSSYSTELYAPSGYRMKNLDKQLICQNTFTMANSSSVTVH